MSQKRCNSITAFTLAEVFYPAGKSRKTAFTLAEVLITLGIIGIVAVLTIPQLISGYKKHVTVSQLKAAYTMLNEAYRLSLAEHDDYLKIRFNNTKYTDELSKQDFNKYLRPYLNVIGECSTLVKCGYDSNSPFTAIYKNEPETWVLQNHHRYYKLGNGMTLFYRDINANGSGFADIFLSVDLNGPKPPNYVGVDLFSFVVGSETNYTTVVPRLYTWDKKLLDSECINRSYGGVGCGAKIMKDGWQISNDYPYKF